jgi:hypothetical protein
MRYSNVYESFFDFLVGMSDKDIKDILIRLDRFISENPNYSFDNKYNLPGLCPIERIGQSIVITPEKLRKAIKIVNKKVDDIDIYTIKGKLWRGDVLVLADSDVSSKRKKTVYQPQWDNYFENPLFYQRQYKRNYGKRTKKNYYDSNYFDRQYYNPKHYDSRYKFAFEHKTNEGRISDFIQFLNKDSGSSSSIDYNIELSLFKIYYFLENNKSYDYDKKSDTPGIIFLSMLSEYTSVPYKELQHIIEKGLIPNAESVRYNYGSIDGPVILFYKPHEDRVKSYKDKFESIFEEPFPSDEDDLLDVPQVDVPYQTPTTTPTPSQFVSTPSATTTPPQTSTGKSSNVKSYLDMDVLQKKDTGKTTTQSPSNKGISIDAIKKPNRVELVKEVADDKLNTLIKDSIDRMQTKDEFISEFNTILYEAPKTKNEITIQNKILGEITTKLLDKDSEFFKVYSDLKPIFFGIEDLTNNDVLEIIKKLSLFIVIKKEGRDLIMDTLKEAYDILP